MTPLPSEALVPGVHGAALAVEGRLVDNVLKLAGVALLQGHARPCKQGVLPLLVQLESLDLILRHGPDSAGVYETQAEAEDAEERKEE